LKVRRGFRAKPVFFTVFGIGFLAAYIYVFNIGALLGMFSEANLTLCLLAFLESVFFMLLYAVGWYVVLKGLNTPVRFNQCLAVSLVSIFGDILIPTGSLTGEAFRLFLARSKMGIETGKATLSIIVHRLLNAVAFIVLLAFAVLTYAQLTMGSTPLQAGYAVMIGGSIIICVLGFYVSFNVKRVSPLIFRLTRLIDRLKGGNTLTNAALKLVDSFDQGARIIFRKRRMLFLALIVLFFQWFTGILIPFTVFYAIGYQVEFYVVAAAYPLYGLITLIPVGIPAMMGVLEFAMTSTFMAFGIPQAPASLATILTRIVTVWFTVIVTGIFTVYYASDLLSTIKLS